MCIHCNIFQDMDMLKNMIITWNPAKNEILKERRGVDFNDVLIAIMENRVLDVVTHVNKDKYPNQSMMIIEIDNYIYVVPFVTEGDKTLFLKTIYPSRKATAQCIDEMEDSNNEKK